MTAVSRGLWCLLASADGMHSPQMRQRLEADGSQPAERMTPEELKATVARDHTEFEQQVKQLDLKLN
ncbi:MAG: hypothetical protein ACXWUS_11265 [Burkholderiales bacterium]